MVDACRTIPRGVEVVLHVRVVSEELAVLIHGAAVDITEARGEDLELFPVWSEAVDDAAGGEHVAVVSAAIGHAGQEMVITPHRRYRRVGRGFRLHGVIARDEVEGFAVGGGDDGVDTVVAAGLDFAEEFHLVEGVVTIGVADTVDTAGDLLFIVVHADVERTEGEDHSVHAADTDGQFLHVGRLERLAGGGSREAVERTILVARVDPALVVGAECDPGALFGIRDGIE